MKLLLVVTSLCLVSCQTVVTRQAHVMPLLGDNVLISAKPKFYGDTGEFNDTGEGTPPKTWAYERYSDGSMRIIWTIARGAREDLVIMDSGVHDMKVPAEAIQTIDRKAIELQASRPTELRTGPNTAFLADAVKLRPYKR